MREVRQLLYTRRNVVKKVATRYSKPQASTSGVLSSGSCGNVIIDKPYIDGVVFFHIPSLQLCDFIIFLVRGYPILRNADYTNGMSTLKTTVNDNSVEDFINAVPDATKREDSFVLLKLFSKITGQKPKMWGSSIIGFGMYHYKSERSTQEGDWPLAAFSPRKQNLTLYFMPGFDKYTALLAKLGKHKTSKGCLYINKLADVDMAVLEKLITQSYVEAKKEYS